MELWSISIQNFVTLTQRMNFKWKMTTNKFTAYHAIVVYNTLVCEY